VSGRTNDPAPSRRRDDTPTRAAPRPDVAGPGAPLDADTRAFMERGFGHDFGKIRVHADSAAASSAAAEGAAAYTTGDDVVFGAGQYSPESPFGRAVIAHELAHSVQQEGGGDASATESPSMERAADDAAMQVLGGGRADVAPTSGAPAVQFLKLTQGALGKALEVYTKRYSVEDRAIRLLQASPTFMRLAATIDANFVWRGDSYKDTPTGDRGPDGRLTEGRFKGRRELFDVLQGPAEFEPFEAPAGPGQGKVSGDVLQLSATSTPEFVQELAHEATHAARSVGAATPPPATLAAEVEAGIVEEVEARKSEAKIVGEIPSKDVKARVADVGSRDPADVERDVSPALGMTYLENSFFGGRLRETQKADGLADDEAEKIRDDVEKQVKTGAKSAFTVNPHARPSGIYDLSTYADVWMDRRTAQVEWAEFQKNWSPNDPDYAAEKEKLVQDHATRFFGGRVSYRALPAQAATP